MNAADLVKRFEGYRSKAYRCPAGRWTCGWGHTRGVTQATTCTLGQAETWLCGDLTEAGQAVDRLVKVHLTPNQRAALLDFVYNVGPDEDRDGIAEGLGDSELLRLLNAGDYAGAAAEFPKWRKGGGKVLPGLVARRAAERVLFEDPDPDRPLAA